MVELLLTAEQIEDLEKMRNCSDTGASGYHPWDSIRFDRHKWSENSKLDALAVKLASLSLPAKGFVEDRCVLHMKAVLLNLYVCYVKHGAMYVAYHRGQNEYKPSSRYEELRLKREYVVHAVDTLIANDLIDHWPGIIHAKRKEDRRLPRMRANEMLCKFFDAVGDVKIIPHQNRECLILRDKDKKNIEYGKILKGEFVDSQSVNGMRKRLMKINRLIADSDIKIDITESELRELNFQRRKEKKSEIDLNDTFLRRIFNVKFNLGGRFYNGWWESVPKNLRPHILVDGERTIELDYSAIHPNILYLIETDGLCAGDPYVLAPYVGDKDMRALVKKVFLVLLNAPTHESANSVLKKDIPRESKLSVRAKELFQSLKLETLFEQIKEAHPVIWKYMGTDQSGRLQYEDSCIADKVLSSLETQNIACLPVHDSFIVQARHETVLREVMTKAFLDKWGACPAIG